MQPVDGRIVGLSPHSTPCGPSLCMIHEASTLCCLVFFPHPPPPLPPTLLLLLQLGIAEVPSHHAFLLHIAKTDTTSLSAPHSTSLRNQVCNQDLRQPLPPHLPQSYQLITGTPPYIPPGAGGQSNRPQKGPCCVEIRGNEGEVLGLMKSMLV